MEQPGIVRAGALAILANLGYDNVTGECEAGSKKDGGDYGKKDG